MQIIKSLVWVFFISLIIGNVYVFVSGIKLSDQLNHYETDMDRLSLENLDMEKKVYEVESLRYTATVAASLGFTEKTSPLVIDNNLKYALNKQ